MHCATVHSGCASRTSAAAPPTSGVESDVPLAGAVALLLLATAQVVLTPCATTSGLMRPSAVLPRLEKVAIEFVELTAPHERMLSASAGLQMERPSGPSFPIAFATRIPRRAARIAACAIAVVWPSSCAHV